MNSVGDGVLTSLAGFGEQAYSFGEKGRILHWVDVVRGPTSCEALLGFGS